MSKELTVSITEPEISNKQTWIKGEISTTTTLGDANLRNPHISQNLNVSVWFHEDGKHAVHIDQNTWVYLGGIMGEDKYSNTELLRGEFSLAELRLISNTLIQFLNDVETGEVSSK